MRSAFIPSLEIHVYWPFYAFVSATGLIRLLLACSCDFDAYHVYNDQPVQMGSLVGAFIAFINNEMKWKTLSLTVQV